MKPALEEHSAAERVVRLAMWWRYLLLLLALLPLSLLLPLLLVLVLACIRWEIAFAASMGDPPPMLIRVSMVGSWVTRSATGARCFHALEDASVVGE